MKRKGRLVELGAIALVGTLAATAQMASAAVIDSANVGGYRTFQDTNTGWVWLDLDNFFGQTPDAMIAAVTAAGFTFARQGAMVSLLSSLPLTQGEWSSYKAIMGGAPNRDLIWGVWDDDGEDPFDDYSQVGEAYAYPGSTSWYIDDNSVFRTQIVGDGTPYADLNIWAYQAPAVVPLPAGLPLFVTALASFGLLGLRRRG